MVIEESEEKLSAGRKKCFAEAKPGFLVDVSTAAGDPSKKYKLVLEKDEVSKTMTVIALSQENLLRLAAGSVPDTETVSVDDLLNLYPTA